MEVADPRPQKKPKGRLDNKYRPVKREQPFPEAKASQIGTCPVPALELPSGRRYLALPMGWRRLTPELEEYLKAL